MDMIENLIIGKSLTLIKHQLISIKMMKLK